MSFRLFGRLLVNVLVAIIFWTFFWPYIATPINNLLQSVPGETSFLFDAINKVLDLNQDSLAEYFSGKEKLFAFFIGQIMKETRGKANPAMVNDLLKKEIDKRK